MLPRRVEETDPLPCSPGLPLGSRLPGRSLYPLPKLNQVSVRLSIQRLRKSRYLNRRIRPVSALSSRDADRRRRRHGTSSYRFLGKSEGSATAPDPAHQTIGTQCIAQLIHSRTRVLGSYEPNPVTCGAEHRSPRCPKRFGSYRAVCSSVLAVTA